jgi:protein O-mannosyl-transferase
MNHDSPAVHSDARDRWVVGFVALAASVAGLLNDFVYDDIAIIRDNVRIHGFEHWREILTLPYWPPPFVQQLYRPATLFLLALECRLGGGSPIVFRLVSYALYVMSALAVFWLASRLMSRRAALCSALLFAVHPVHVEAVALGVGQAELVVGILAVAMVYRYIERRRAGGLTTRDWLLLAVLYAVAALCKENGFVLPALLMAAELLPLDALSLRKRIAKLWLGYAGLAAVAAVLIAIRVAVLRGQAFHVVATASIAGLSIGGRAIAMLQIVPMWLQRFVFPAHLQVDYTPTTAASGNSTFQVLAGVAIIVCALAIVVLSRRRAPVLAFGLAWCIIGLLPVSNLIATGVVLAERTLFLPSIGVVIAVGGLAEWILAQRPGATPRRVATAACGVLLILGIVRSASRHHVWNSKHLVVVKSLVKN